MIPLLYQLQSLLHLEIALLLTENIILNLLFSFWFSFEGIVIEENLREELKASHDSLLSWYDQDFLNAVDSEGHEHKTCFVIVKDLNHM